jgi:hypothetical protein
LNGQDKVKPVSGLDDADWPWDYSACPGDRRSSMTRQDKLEAKLEELGIDRSESDQWDLRENMEEIEDD